MTPPYTTPSPPRLARRLLAIILPRRIRDALITDIGEAYATRAAGSAQRPHARWWYWHQVARACWPPTLVALHLAYRDHTPLPNAAGILEILRDDVCAAGRGLRRRPIFSAMIIVTIALGVGATSTMFGILDRLLLRAPPHITHADRVFLLSVRRTGAPWTQTSQPYVVRTVLERGVPDFAQVAVATPTAVVHRQYFPAGRGVTASRVAGALVSANYFALLGVHPALGRFFQRDEDTDTGTPNTAVLGYAYWRQQYAGSRDVIGRTIEVGRSAYTIVGVAPEGFTGTELRDVDVWLPIGAAGALRFGNNPRWATDPSSQWLLVLARVRPGIAPAHAAAEATAAYRAWLRTTILDPSTERLAAVDSQNVVLGSIVPGRSLWTWAGSGSGNDARISELLGGVALVVLLIACANVANLLLVRALGRRREIAVRIALGVSRRRLVSQLVVEGVVLALIGTAGALAVAQAASPALRRWLIGEGAWSGTAIGGRMLAITAGVGLLTGIITSLAPALQAIRSDAATSLKAGARDGTVQRSRMRTALLVTQAALAIVLLSGAGFFLRSLRNAAALDLGVDRDHVLIAQLDQNVLGMQGADLHQLFDELAASARTVPGIDRAAVSIGLPFGLSWGTAVSAPGRELPTSGRSPVQYAVSAPYFDALGIRTLRGRAFDAGDRATSAPVAIINETMARLDWPDRNPIGECVRIEDTAAPCATIVGVVSNTNRQDLIEAPVAQIYRPLDQVPARESRSVLSSFGYTLVAHSRGNAVALVEPLRRALQSTRPSMPYVNVTALDDVIGQQTRTWATGARVFTAVGALALLLAGVGLFSVIAFAIGQRMHEFGVRTALGARRVDLLWHTMARGVAPAAAGILVGVLLTLAGGRFLTSLLFQESPFDPVALGVASAIMLACAVAASLVPAVRAAHVDPTIALRAD